MLRIADTIFSLDIIEKKFKCNLPQCLGNCCRYGDSGAPLTDSEVQILEDNRQLIKPYLRPEGVAAIEGKGTSTIDFESDKVTPLIGNEECAYTIFNGNIFMCGIEKAWSDGKTSLQKPLSCHLFPVKIRHYSDFRAVNYQELSICHPALKCGDAEGIYLYEFLKIPLIRALGEEIYNDLCVAAKELRKDKKL